jgi:hydroxymethylpyrimidine/phosphomethylpyrimidine kinase
VIYDLSFSFLSWYLNHNICLNDIAFLDIIESIHNKTTFKSCLNFLYVVLETLQRCKLTLEDLLTFPDGTEIWFPGKRIANPNTHGTGCTLSSAIAANLAKGFALEEAIARAKAYLTDALNAQLDLGRGSGPLDHTLGGVGVENWMHGVPDAVHK